MTLIRDREVLSDKIKLYSICANKYFTKIKTIIMPADTRNYESIEEDRILLGSLGTGSSFTFLPSMALTAVWTS